MKSQQIQKRHPVDYILTTIAILIVAAGLVFGIRYLMRLGHYEETNDAQVEAFINPVSARAGGYIKNVLFKEHQQVKKGDTLVTLDDREYRIKVAEAEAAIDNANAQLKVLEAGIRAAETGSLVNQDQVVSAKARLWQQEQDIKRYRNLIKEEAVTGQEFEQVKSHYDVSMADFNAAKNGVKASVSKIEELKSRRDLLKADLKLKESNLELAKVNLSYTVITAPANGTIGRKTILEGQQIQPGQPLVFLVNEKEKWVTANFKETQINRMYIGQPVSIVIDAIEGRTFTGQIEAIAASTGAKFSLLPPDNSTGNFVKIVQRIPVKIRFTSPDLQVVRAGMNADISIKMSAKND